MCRQPVHLVTTYHEFEDRVANGDCVAVVRPEEVPERSAMDQFGKLHGRSRS